ncbi:MAG: 7-cyano-7-deazaguanine synthase QueC [Planctomycetaceae bacterium]
MTNPQKRAVVLVSGGLDSATVLAIARRQEFELYAITFDYGQRHRVEMEAAKRVCNAAGVAKQIVFPLDFRAFGGSALTSDLPVPKNRSDAQMSADIPITYVPARNTVFLSIALGWAEVLKANDIFLGVNAVDYSGYPDCRPEFIAAFTTLANLATKTGVEEHQPFRVHTPLISLTKAEIIRKGVELGVDYSLTHSCYDPDAIGTSCGQCDSCQLRLKGFADAGLVDPVRYGK